MKRYYVVGWCGSPDMRKCGVESAREWVLDMLTQSVHRVVVQYRECTKF